MKEVFVYAIVSPKWPCCTSVITGGLLSTINVFERPRVATPALSLASIATE